MARGKPITELDLPVLLDRYLRRRITGAYIVERAITPDYLDVDTLSAITANLGRVNAGTIQLGGGGNTITITSDPYPRISAEADGVPIFLLTVARPPTVYPRPGVAVPHDVLLAMGDYITGVGWPVEIRLSPLPGTHNRLVIRPQALLVGKYAKTLMTGDFIWIGTSETPLEKGSRGVYLSVDGIWAARATSPTTTPVFVAGLDAETGQFHAGARGQVRMDEMGLTIVANTDTSSPPDNDAGIRFLDPATGNVIGGVTMDANAVPGHAYLNVFSLQHPTLYTEMNLAVQRTVGGSALAGITIGVTKDGVTSLDTRNLDSLTLTAGAVYLKPGRMDAVWVRLPDGSPGAIDATLRLENTGFHYPTSPEGMPNYGFEVRFEGDQARIYYRQGDRLYYWQADGVQQ